MKNNSITRTALIALLSASVFVACKDDNKDDDFKNENSLGIPESVSSADNAVDLGLTSGTKWAKMNVGAANPWEFGDYFAWGETTPKETYDWSTYLHMAPGQTKEGQEWRQINKYQPDEGSDGIWYNNIKFIGDSITTLAPEDDAAAVNWGGDWVMPSPQDYQELRANCEYEETGDYKGTGVAGLILKGNGNEVFFPYAGYKLPWDENAFNEGYIGPLWTNELGNGTNGGIHIWTLKRDLTNYDFKNDYYGRANGLCVRAVCKAGGNANGHEAVDFGLPSGKLWATMNIGAQKIEDYGYYLAWGETEPKVIYNDSTYKYSVRTETGYSYNKYQVADNSIGGVWYTKEFVGDGKTQLDDVDDAAVANWGGKWKMPTEEQLVELQNECYWLYTENYADTTNVRGYIVYKAKAAADKGRKVTLYDFIDSTSAPLEGYSLVDTHIFIPIAGFKRGEELSDATYSSYYWMSTLAWVGSAISLNAADVWGYTNMQRYYGLTVRPVCK